MTDSSEYPTLEESYPSKDVSLPPSSNPPEFPTLDESFGSPPSSWGTTGQATPNLKLPDWLSKIYHPLAEGGAVSAGASAGAAIGAVTSPVTGPVGPLAGAIAGGAAFYPAGKYIADAIDKIRGIATEQASIPQQMKEGAKIEVGGQILGPATKLAADNLGEMVSKIVEPSKVGEALSGTPASNLSRAFKGGFVKTFLSPMTVNEAGEDYGEAFNKVMGDYYTPEQQADLLLNPNGIAKQNLSTVIQKVAQGQTPTVQEAIAARQGINQLMPSQTAKSLPRVQGFSSLRSYLNDIIGKEAPDFKEASDNYAAAKLRDQLLKFAQVNKSNPNEYSKLGAMMMKSMAVLGGVGFGSGSPMAPLMGAAIQGASSPFAMGLVSAASGTASRATIKALANPLIQRGISAALDDYFGDHEIQNSTAPNDQNSTSMN